jgi:hypothetical protein
LSLLVWLWSPFFLFQKLQPNTPVAIVVTVVQTPVKGLNQSSNHTCICRAGSKGGLTVIVKFAFFVIFVTCGLEIVIFSAGIETFVGEEMLANIGTVCVLGSAFLVSICTLEIAVPEGGIDIGLLEKLI